MVKTSLAWLRVTTGTALIVICGCNPGVDEVKGLIGKTRTEVIEALGEPDGHTAYDTAMLDPSKHTKTEIDAWFESTPQTGLKYGSVWIEFNASDVAIGIKPR